MASISGDEVLARIHNAQKSSTKRFAELISMANDEWAAEVEKITGKTKEKLLQSLEWGRKELGKYVSETEVKALATIAADEKGVIS